MSENEKQLFENLALQNMDDLYSRAIRLAGNAEGAEFLVQQTYAIAFGIFEQFDKNNDFAEWLSGLLMLVYMTDKSDFCYKSFLATIALNAPLGTVKT